MEQSLVTNLQLVIRNEELAKCRDEGAMKIYINETILPLIHHSLSTKSKGVEGEVGIRCDRGGCSIRGSIRG